LGLSKNLRTSTFGLFIAQVKNIIRGNRDQIVREVVDEVVISSSSCRIILTEGLGMHWVSTKFVNLEKNIITGDDTWDYDYDFETIQHS
jgi:hypothetical protein